MTTERKLDIALSQWTVQALSRLALTFALFAGALILAGGEERFGSRSYADALTYPGAPDSWGWVSFAIGIFGLSTSLWGRLRMTWWALMGLAVWSGFFGLSFATTAMDDPRASTTGAAVYFYLAVNSVVLGVAHRRSYKWKK